MRMAWLLPLWLGIPLGCSDGSAWSVRWVERIDDDRIVAVWREGCGDPSTDRARIEAVRLADGSVEDGTGGEGAVHVIAKTPGVLWYFANGTYAVDLPGMVRHRVESSLSAHPQVGASSPSGPRARGVSGDLLVLIGTDGRQYVASASGEVLRVEEHVVAPIPDLRTDLVPDLRRPSADDAKRTRVYYVVEAGRPVRAGTDRWLVVSSSYRRAGQTDRQNLHAVGSEGVAWSRAVADLVGAPVGADTRLIWASDADGLHVVVSSQVGDDEACRFANALVRLNPQTGETMATHALAPTP